MKRTHATSVLVTALIGLVAGFLLETALTASGKMLIVPPVSLPITLVIIAVIVVVLAVPIGRATRGKSNRPINPFVAMRVAVLAKSSSLSGALLLGGGLGMLAYILTRSVLPGANTVGLAIGMAVAAAALLAAGLVAEHLCTLPPDDRDLEKGADRAGAS